MLLLKKRGGGGGGGGDKEEAQRPKIPGFWCELLLEKCKTKYTLHLLTINRVSKTHCYLFICM